MPKSLQAIGTDALQKTPKPLQRVLHGLDLQFQQSAPDEYHADGNYDSSNIAGVPAGDPRSIRVMAPDAFTRNAPQLVTHEGTHSWQNNLPPALQAKIPADNPQDPYNYGGTSAIKSLMKRGGTLLDLPREQQAAAMQYGQSQGMPEPYKSLANTMNSIPMSQIDMTDPNAKTINTHPRAPLPPIMNYATDTYKKGDPPPGDDPYAAFVQTGTVGGKAPDTTPSGVAQGVSNPSAASADTDPYANYAGAQETPDEPYSMQLLKGIPGAAKSVGTGILKGLGSDAANLTGSDRLKALTAISGDENDQAGQKFGKGLEQAGEFLIPGLGEEAAVSKLGKLAPLGKLAYNSATAALLNKAQGGDATTGAIAGGLGSAGGQLLEKAAPAVAEQALGIRGRVDRAFNKEPGRAVLDEIKGVRPDTIAENARSRINELSGQVEDVADKASAAPPQVNYLKRGGDIDYPGTEASLPPVQQGHTRLFRSESPTTGFKDVFNADALKDFGSNRPPGKAYTTNLPYADYYRDAYGPDATTHFLDVPEKQAQAAKFGDSEYVMGETKPSLAPARDIVNDAMGNFSGARQNAAGTSGQLGDMSNFLNKEFDTGNAIPLNVTPRRLLDLRRGFNEEFGQWNPERKDATINTGRRAYSALSNELHNTLPDIAPLDARISNLIPVKNRAQVKALGDDTVARTLGRIARPTGALAGLGTGAYVGGKEGGTAGAIEGGLLGLVLPELMSSPTGQMVTARTLNNAGALRPLVGAGLQFDRRPQQ